MPGPNLNLSQFVTPFAPSAGPDITAGLRQWQAQHLDEARLQEQQRQFNQEETRKESEFSQELGYKNRVSNDINSRFSLEQGEKTNARGYEQEQGRYQKQLELLNKARFSASQGRWNEVESMLGSLKELGANVGRSMDQDGKPIYHLEAGQQPSASGETFNSAINKINGNQGQQESPYQFNPEQPTISQQPQKSPFDTQLGTTGYQFNPSQPTISQNNPEPSQEPSQQQTPAFDPYEINSSQLNQMNESRLRPLMEGIENAFPNRFQPQIGALLHGIGALGTSPESYLIALQKPMDTAAHLMGAELNAEGQMARAGMSQSNSESSQDRLLANDGRTAAQRVLKEYGIKDAVDNSLNMDKVRTLIMSNNRNANAQGIKELIKMVEGSRITDKDFDIAASGYASDWEQASQRLTRVYQDGLTPSQKSNFNHMIEMYQSSNKVRIGTAAKKLTNFISKFRTEPERYGAYNEVMGGIPDEYLPDEIREWDPSRNFGGRRAKPTSQSSSVSVTAPTSQQAVQGAEELNNSQDHGDEFQ